jgi:hypothetical protein
MIPNVFVSSTIEDLHHLRDVVREAIEELGYNPIMSEYGDIGFVMTSLDQACSAAARQCQLAVVIVGKRYGSILEGPLSVTHQEFRALRDSNIPVITLVDADVWAFRRVYDANPNTAAVFPGMEAPARTFDLLHEIVTSPVHSAIQPFHNASEARVHIKKQLAHFVGDLLRDKVPTIEPQLRDILAELKTLRHSLRQSVSDTDRSFLRLMKALLEPSARPLRDVVETLHDGLESAAEPLLRVGTFDEFVAASGWTLVVNDDAVVEARASNPPYYGTFGVSIDGSSVQGVIVASTMQRLVLNEAAGTRLRALFQELKGTVNAEGL